MHFEIRATTGVPPYQQIVDQVVAAVRSGELVTGERLPTVRGLAAELDLAANTVAKAYRLLEAEGHVETLGRRGTVVTGTDLPGQDEIGAAADAFAQAARRGGLDLDETIGVLRRVW